MTAPLVFTLPWPPSALSPNTRQHWSKLAKAKKRYRLACWAEVIQTTGLWNPIAPDCIALEVEFVRPDRRSYDVDNLLARFKAGLDGMASALEFDDARIRSTTVTIADEPVRGGAVHVRLRDHNETRTAGAPVSAQRGNTEAREGQCQQPQ